jgi:tetratricopeptide (TPR) repeat protein/predicted aspartyl protease
MNLFGGIMQSVIMQTTLAEWRKLPPDELSCIDETLRRRGVNVQSLMQQGIAPFDSRLSDVRASCRPSPEPNLSQLPPTSIQSTEKSEYVVDGHSLGAQVAFNSAAYREYQCNPSEQFSGLIWCQKQRNETGPRGAFRSSYTIMHSQDGTTLYVNHYLEPAFFGSGDADAEIERLSQRFGTQPRLIRMPSGSDQAFTNGIIASWGNVVLEPLDSSIRGQLAAGSNPHGGIMLDFISNFQRSAQQGLPMFHVSGGAGFVWAASFDQSGRGRLRFFAIDASTFTSIVGPDNPSQPQPIPSDPWKDCQASDTDTRQKGCTIVIDAKGYGSRTRLADALDGRCRAYNDRQNYEQAIVDCKAAIDANPRYSYAYANLATSYLHLKDVSNAIVALDRAIELKTNFIWSRLNRAEAFEASGNNRDALKDYEYALLVDSSNQQASDGVIRLFQGTNTNAPATLAPGCARDMPVFSLDSQTSSQSSNRTAPATRSSVSLEKAISALNNYVTKLHDQAEGNTEWSAQVKREADQQRTQLASRVQESRKAANEVQRLVELSSEAAARVDQLSEQIADLQKKVESASHNPSSPNNRAGREATQAIRTELDKLRSAKLQAERDARAKLSTLSTAKEAAEREASEYASGFVEIHNRDVDAGRAAQCATDVGQLIDQLTKKVSELRVKQTNEQFKIEQDLAETLLADVAEFAKQIPNVVPLEIAPLITHLKATLGAGDPQAILQARTPLESRLNDIVEFRQFISALRATRDEKHKAELADVEARVRIVSDFIQYYVRSHITSDAVEHLLKLNEDVTAALISPQIDSLTDLLATADSKLGDLGLGKEFAEFKAKNSKGSWRDLLSKTDKNRYLIEGPDDEIVFLINDTGRAHVVRNLHGQLVFDDGKASVCFPHAADFERFGLLQIKLEVLSKGAREVSLANAPCAMNAINKYDVIAVARWLLLRTSRETAQTLLDAIENDELSKISVLTDREIKNRHDNESVASLELANDIDKSVKSGYGIVATENRSSIICQTVDDHPKTHESLVNGKLERLEYEFQSRPRVVATSIDDAFIAIKRQECRAVYASAENLKILIQGLKRDKINYHVVPIWFSKEDFDAEARAVANREAEYERQQRALIQKKHDEDEGEKRRLQQTEVARQQWQEEVRKQYGSAARSLEKAISLEIKEFVDSPTEKHVGARQKYPQFVNWYQGVLRDGWELLSVDSALDDYGVVEWKGRVLEVGFVESRIKMQNRDLGEYKTSCYVFSYVLDKDFDVARDPKWVGCDEQTTIARYKLGQRFSSRWIAGSSLPSGSQTPPVPDRSSPLLPPKDSGGSPDQITPSPVDKRGDLGTGTPPPGSQLAAPVAQRAALYEEDPGDPQGKRVVGSVVWRTETVSPGPGLAAEPAVRADVEIPERIAMKWLFRRNTNKSPPASHVIEIIFTLPVDFPSGGVADVPGLLMKQTEQARGTPVAGLAVKVTNGFFLIGLSTDTDVRMLKNQPWFDIPIIYNNGSRAILAMEKGTPGERAFTDAFATWANVSPPSQPASIERPTSNAPISVPMQIEGGIYVVPVLINDAITLNFAVDSGASDVSIPADVVMTLMRTRTLKESDFLGAKTYVLADGSEVPSQTFRIRSLTVGNKVLENVNGSVASAQGSLLLGQSFLGRFKSWSIDNARQALVLEW